MGTCRARAGLGRCHEYASHAARTRRTFRDHKAFGIDARAHLRRRGPRLWRLVPAARGGGGGPSGGLRCGRHAASGAEQVGERVVALLRCELRWREALGGARRRARAACEQHLRERDVPFGRRAVQQREAVVEAATLLGRDGGAAVDERDEVIGRPVYRQLVGVGHRDARRREQCAPEGGSGLRRDEVLLRRRTLVRRPAQRAPIRSKSQLAKVSPCPDGSCASSPQRPHAPVEHSAPPPYQPSVRAGCALSARGAPDSCRLRQKRPFPPPKLCCCCYSRPNPAARRCGPGERARTSLPETPPGSCNAAPLPPDQLSTLRLQLSPPNVA